ncbi:hypothetical protein [Clostridium tagluense]|uniref:hypothetical protein n=1 Tax=Clostridium tagluense TaxID=360422 RepID=UPI001CF4A7E4|nr:hypothetical protein [Clostridium tagluense]MCB2296753.1 hypothetical protein [Clostridium tagluense]
MNKKIISSLVAAVMISAATTFTAYAAMANGSVVIGNKAFGLAYANDPTNIIEITNEIVAGGAIYIKNFQGIWINNKTGLPVVAGAIPAVVYKSATEKIKFDAADKDVVVTTAVDNAAKIATATVAVVKAEISRLKADIDSASAVVNALSSDFSLNTIREELITRLKLVKALDITDPVLNSVSLVIGQSVSATKNAGGNFKVSLAARKDTDMLTAITLNASEKATIKILAMGNSKTFTTDDSGKVTIIVADILGSFAPKGDGMSVKTLKNYLTLMNDAVRLNVTLKDGAGNETATTITITAY